MVSSSDLTSLRWWLVEILELGRRVEEVEGKEEIVLFQPILLEIQEKMVKTIITKDLLL